MLNEQEIIANELLGLNNWNEISRREDLLNEDLRKYKDKLDWEYLIKHHINSISNELLDDLITEEILNINDKTLWRYVSILHAEDEKFIKKYFLYLDMKRIMIRNDISCSYIANFKNFIYIPKIGEKMKKLSFPKRTNNLHTEINFNDIIPKDMIYTIIDVNKELMKLTILIDDSKKLINKEEEMLELSLDNFYRWKDKNGIITSMLNKKINVE